MRPLRLEMEGFATFSQRTLVDFVGADFFALLGPTGAGKSTVMDAICFALYGRVPRWGTGIEYALAPSATSGKVQLVFSADKHLYVATRIVKRGAKGKVTTSSAALERLPANVSVGDLAEVGQFVGTALAGSAKGVTDQVERIVGLPFDQFTKCVLLPQGAFADFLHANGAERRKILENLLGYSVYRDIQTAAGEKHREAEAVLQHIDSQLRQLPTVTDDDLTLAAERIDRLRELGLSVRATVPRLEELAREAAGADEALKVIDEEHALLTYIRLPADVASISDELASTARAVEVARREVTLAEEAEERLRAEVADSDVSRIDQLLKDHASATELTEKIKTGTPLTRRAEEAVTQIESEVVTASGAVVVAEQALESAMTADLASSLRETLAIGAPCPVCDQHVASMPPHTAHETVSRCRERLAKAKDDLAAARQKLTKTQSAAHKYRGRLEELLDQQASLAKELSGAPTVAELRTARQSADARRQQLSDASQSVRVAREDLRRNEKTHSTVVSRQASEWQKFDHHRDRVARLSPPPTDRSDLAAAWSALSAWAHQQLEVRKERRHGQIRAKEKLESQTRIIHNELSVQLAEAEVAATPGASGADFSEIVTSAFHQAETRQRQLLAQREQFVSLSSQRSEHAHEAEVAKELHKHLGTKQFVNWLLTEALDELVAGASEILRQLTSGQYDLTYQDSDFYVIDHHDADLTRPAKTLSGGETFAAALSLALAMSDQLAGLSSKGACLEAILLDEGFGTLDAATLDQVAASLESLAASGSRMVGVVTHVSGLAERIPVRFEISKDAHGSHVSRMDM